VRDGPTSLQPAPLHRTPSVAIYDVRCRPCDYGRGPEEWSRVNQIVFPRSGVFLGEMRGEEVLADANHVLFFGRNETYRVTHPARCGDDCTVFAFEDALLIEAVGIHDLRVQERPEQLFRFTHTSSDQGTFLLHERLRQALLAGPGDKLAVDMAALGLLAALMRHAYRSRGIQGPRRRDTTCEAHRDQAERTKLFLALRLSEDLALDDVARAVHCSAFHLARLFRRETGLTIHQYRNRLRLRAALERLVHGERDLTALALELGFSSHGHFGAVFRRGFGVTPSACRQSLSGKRLRELSKNLEATGRGAT
jgi:AraC-like DNA-binding protein